MGELGRTEYFLQPPSLSIELLKHCCRGLNVKGGITTEKGAVSPHVSNNAPQIELSWDLLVLHGVIKLQPNYIFFIFYAEYELKYQSNFLVKK